MPSPPPRAATTVWRASPALGARALRLDVAIGREAAALAWPIDGEAFDVAIYCAGRVRAAHRRSGAADAKPISTP